LKGLPQPPTGYKGAKINIRKRGRGEERVKGTKKKWKLQRKGSKSLAKGT